MHTGKLIVMIVAFTLATLTAGAEELAGVRGYLEAGKTPKFIRFNVDGYNLRTSPNFSPSKTDNIDSKTKNGQLYAVTRMVKLQRGVAVGVLVNGQERWVYVPVNHAHHFQFCETNACLSDVAEGIDRLLEINAFTRDQLRDCLTGEQGDEIARLLTPNSTPVTPRTVEDIAPALIPPSRGRDVTDPAEEEARVTPPPARIHKPRPDVQPDAQPLRRGACIADTRNSTRPDFRAIRDVRARKKAFVDYMAPFALEVQEATGLPASVIISQAAIETGWGTSSLFRRSNSLFGHSCWRQGSEQKYRIQIRGEWKEIKASCNEARPANERGFYLKFDSAQDSVYAYAANLLHTPSTQRFYPELRAAVAKARPGVASWREVADGLKRYAADQSYAHTVAAIINQERMFEIEGKQVCR